MDTNTIPDAYLATLLTSDRETGGKPVLSNESRPVLQAAVEEILVNLDKLHNHIRRLQAKLGTDFRHNERLPDYLTDLVIERGIGVLDNDDLAMLILNPVALHVLFDEIHEQFSDAWLTVMERQGRALWEAAGRPITNLTPFLKEADVRIPRLRESVLPKRKKPSPETMRSLMEEFRHQRSGVGNLNLAALTSSSEVASDRDNGSESRYGLVGSLRIEGQVLEFYLKGNLVLASCAGEPLSVLEIDGVPYVLTPCKEFEGAMAVEGLTHEWIARVIQDLESDPAAHTCRVQ